MFPRLYSFLGGVKTWSQGGSNTKPVFLTCNSEPTRYHTWVIHLILSQKVVGYRHGCKGLSVCWRLPAQGCWLLVSVLVLELAWWGWWRWRPRTAGSRGSHVNERSSYGLIGISLCYIKTFIHPSWVILNAISSEMVSFYTQDLANPGITCLWSTLNLLYASQL